MKKFQVTVEQSYYTTYIVQADSAEEAKTNWEFGEQQGEPFSENSPAQVVHVEEGRTACALTQ